MKKLLILLPLCLLLASCQPLAQTLEPLALKLLSEEAPPPTAAPSPERTPAATPEATATPSPTLPATPTPPATPVPTLIPLGPFTALDLTCQGVAAGASSAQVREALGTPDAAYTQENVLTLEEQLVLEYQGNRLIFNRDRLTEVELNNVALVGPRGIRVNDPVAQVRDIYGLVGDGTPYYSAENGLPPLAEKLMIEGDSHYLILLTAPADPYSEHTLSVIRGYMEELHGQLVYTVSTENDRITAIHWLLAPLSENRNA